MENEKILWSENRYFTKTEDKKGLIRESHGFI